MAFGFFCFYLLLAVISGEMHIGLNFLFIQVHPMKCVLFNQPTLILSNCSLVDTLHTRLPTFNGQRHREICSQCLTWKTNTIRKEQRWALQIILYMHSTAARSVTQMESILQEIESVNNYPENISLTLRAHTPTALQILHVQFLLSTCVKNSHSDLCWFSVQ